MNFHDVVVVIGFYVEIRNISLILMGELHDEYKSGDSFTPLWNMIIYSTISDNFPTIALILL